MRILYQCFNTALIRVDQDRILQSFEFQGNSNQIVEKEAKWIECIIFIILLLLDFYSNFNIYIEN